MNKSCVKAMQAENMKIKAAYVALDGFLHCFGSRVFCDCACVFMPTANKFSPTFEQVSVPHGYEAAFQQARRPCDCSRLLVSLRRTLFVRLLAQTKSRGVVDPFQAALNASI
eukprot:4207052-Pleurochrysis_carterae.AAC.1